jgi:hypothetical protein
MTTTLSQWRLGIIDNTFLPGQQLDGHVATTLGDQYFVVWTDQSYSPSNIVARAFDNLGNPLTGEVNLDPTNTFSTYNLDQPAVTPLPIAGQADGLAVAFTHEYNNGLDGDIWLYRTNANLVKIGTQTVIDASFTPTYNPSITSFSNGSLMVAYTFQNSGTDWDIVARTVSPTGVVSAPITLFNDVDRSDNSDLATLTNGNVVAVTQNEFLGNASDRDIKFTITTQTGANVVSPTFVNGAANTPGDEIFPHVAALADGGFVVSWTDSLGDASGYGIRASVYDANGGLVHGNILVNTFNQAGTQYQNDVTALPDGGFVVSWEDVTAGTNMAQRFDAAGNLFGTPVVLNDHPSFNIDAATLSDGRFISTINDFWSQPNNNVVSSIWDSRIGDANQVSGTNFFGPGGGSGDLLIIADHSGIRTAQALQIENGNLQTAQVIAVVGNNVAFDGAGDFNNDGLMDLLAHSDNGSVRDLFAFQMTPTGVGGTTTLANLGIDWITDSFGDFNQDNTTDILIHRDAGGTRTFEVLSINNYAVQSAPVIQITGVDWVADGTGDFNGDGTSDILEHRVNLNGTMNVQAVTLNNNAVQSVSALATIGSDWQIDGTGDFNGDGVSDILMHRDAPNGPRTFDVLTIRNNAVVSDTVIAQVGNNISVGGIGDFNGDSTSDIVFHQDVGTTRTDLIFDVVNDTVVNTHTAAITGIDWHVA